MITNDQLQIAAELAICLTDKGVTWPQLRAAQKQPKLLRRLMSVLQGSALSVAAVRQRPYTHVLLRDALPDDFMGRRIHEVLREAGVWYVEDLMVCQRRQLATLLHRPGISFSVLERVMNEHGIGFCPDAAQPQTIAQGVYGSVGGTPLRMIMFVSRAESP